VPVYKTLRDFIAATWCSTPLHKACYEGSLDELFADVSQIALRDHNGWTALHVAVYMRRIEASRLLLTGGADIFAVTGGARGHTALHLACSRDHGEIVRLLLLASIGPFDDTKIRRASTIGECLSWAGKA
jgi:ankyrin repeat protein